MKRTGLLLLWFSVALASWATQASTARTIHVEVRGSGAQHLVLIPCAGCDWHSWETFMARHRQRYTMHAVTLPGLGGTARWPVASDAQGTPLLEHCAAEIARYIREKRLPNVVIIGHSFGAAVALKTVLDHPASAAKLFLVDWGAVHPATLTIALEERLQQAAARRSATLEQTDEAFRQQMMAMPATAIANAARVPVYAAMFGQMDRLTSAQISYELRRYDWRARLGELAIPVAAVFGLPEGDEAATSKQEAHAVLPGMRQLQMHFLPNTGHWVMEERPQEFDQLFAAFLAETQAPTKPPAAYPTNPISALIKEWTRARDYTKDYLDAMPEDGLHFKAAPKMRSFAEQMLHLAHMNYIFAHDICGQSHPYREKRLEREEELKASKAVLIKTVLGSYDFMLSAIRKLNEHQLKERLSIFNLSPRPRAVLLQAAFEHQTHHRGQTAVYLRLKGVEPPFERLF